MNFLKLYATDDGCRIPDGFSFLLVSCDLDGEGDFINRGSFYYRTLDELRHAIQRMILAGDDLVIRGSHRFHDLAKDLGCVLGTCEWTNLASNQQVVA